MALLWLAWPARAAAADAVWLDANGRPNPSARDAVRLLADAGADGLAPRDYRAAELAQLAAALAAAPGAVASPRRSPRTGISVARPGIAAPDFAALLQTAAAAGRLPQMAAELRPRFGQYAKLREALGAKPTAARQRCTVCRSR